MRPKKKVAATFMLIPGNSRLGSCVNFEVQLPSGKTLDITGDRVADKELAFESALGKTRAVLDKFDMILDLEDITELAEYYRQYVDEDSRYFLCGRHQITPVNRIQITKRIKIK